MKNLHGGDVYTYPGVVDLSANINPLGIPEKVMESIQKSLFCLENYPDVACRTLRKKIGKNLGCQMESIICGNGAADLLYTFVSVVRPQSALLVIPGFAEYEEALLACDTKIKYYSLREEKEYQLTEDYLEYLTPDIDIAFICTPNNPTGIVIEQELLDRILVRCKKNKIMLVLDECFNDFLDVPEKYSLLGRTEEFDNLFILRSFTKMFALAGLRLGYGIIHNQDIIEKMYLHRQAWTVSIPAQVAGVAALDEIEFVKQTKEFIEEEKNFLYHELDRLSIKYWKSAANFILFQSIENLKEKMLEHRILIRDCSNYKNLSVGYYRIAIKKHSDNQKFIYYLEKELRIK